MLCGRAGQPQTSGRVYLQKPSNCPAVRSKPSRAPNQSTPVKGWDRRVRKQTSTGVASLRRFVQANCEPAHTEVSRAGVRLKDSEAESASFLKPFPPGPRRSAQPTAAGFGSHSVSARDWSSVDVLVTDLHRVAHSGPTPRARRNRIPRPGPQGPGRTGGTPALATAAPAMAHAAALR
jgi:hypothetical protein